MLVSIVTPTYERERFLPLLLDCFRAQTYPELELLVLDDSSEPSALFASGGARDPRIRYRHVRERMTIGEKRNWLVEQSRGSVIAQFDDDDYYAPSYVERMVQKLGPHDLTKLAGWFGFSVAKNQLFYWDTARTSAVQMVLGPNDPLAAIAIQGDVADFVQGSLWGYGFSYVFRKKMLDVARFEARDWGEDHAFLAAARAAGCSLSHFADEEGLALHILHGNNTSRVLPQYLLPAFLTEGLFPGMRLRAYLEAGAVRAE